MIKLSAKIRKKLGKRTKSLKEKGIIPAIVYGAGIKNTVIEVNAAEFKKVFSQTGESSLISLQIDEEKKERPVLINETQKDSLSGKIIHVDFYQPSLKQEVEVAIPLIFEGVALAIKDLGGTLIKEIQEVKVKALPQNLPHDIKVDISSLKTFEDEITIKDLKLPSDVKVSRGQDEVVALVVPAEKVEEELEKPIEEKVEDVEKVEKEKKVKEEVVEEAKPAAPAEKKPTEKK
jgi:large subunit ribosomal protein L25